MIQSYCFMYAYFKFQQTRKKSFKEKEEEPKLNLLPKIAPGKKFSI